LPIYADTWLVVVLALLLLSQTAKLVKEQVQGLLLNRQNLLAANVDGLFSVQKTW
jgi:hypothetical protein